MRAGPRSSASSPGSLRAAMTPNAQAGASRAKAGSTTISPRTCEWSNGDRSRQLGIQRDFGVEELGDRAVLLGFPGHSGERGFVQVRHGGAQRQSRAGDAKALAFGVQSDGGLGTEFRRRIAAALQLKGERHGEAAGVGGGDQLL